MKKFYRVDYKGLWMGGTAIVLADSPKEARAIVEQDETTVDFTNVITTRLGTTGESSRILYNDNGDY